MKTILEFEGRMIRERGGWKSCFIELIANTG